MRPDAGAGKRALKGRPVLRNEPERVDSGEMEQRPARLPQAAGRVSVQGGPRGSMERPVSPEAVTKCQPVSAKIGQIGGFPVKKVSKRVWHTICKRGECRGEKRAAGNLEFN